MDIHNLLSPRKITFKPPPVLIFLTGCFLLLLTYYGQAIFFGHDYFASDHQLYFEPLTNFIGSSFRQMRLPLWNPYIHCGVSQAAIPSPGVFYPPNWLFALLPYGQGLAWIMVLHQLVAGLGAYLFIISLGWGEAAGVTAGLVAALSGYMFSLTCNYTLVATAAWIPTDLWLLSLISTEASKRKIYLLVSATGLTTFMTIAAGRPEVGAPGLALIVLFIFRPSFFSSTTDQAQALEDRPTPNNSHWQWLSLIIGFLMAMIIILPVFEWFLNSPRAQGMPMANVLLWSANWYDIFSMIFAQPFGDLTEIGTPYLNLAASRIGYVPFLTSALIGPVAFTLAIWGFIDKTWKGRNWTLALLFCSLLMILGDNIFFIRKLIELVPFANIFRYPIKLMIFPIFCTALASARGMWCITSNQLTKKSLITTATFWVLILVLGNCLAIAGLLSKPLPLGFFIKFPGAQLLLGQSLLRGAFLGLTTCGLAYLSRTKLKLATICLTILLAGSLFIPAFYYRSHNIAKGYYQQRPFLLKELDKLSRCTNNTQRILPLYFDPLKPPPNGFPGNANNKSLNYFHYYHDLLLPNTNIDWHVAETFGYEASETQDFRQLFVNALGKALPDMKHTTGGATKPDDLPLWHFCRASGTKWVCSQIESYSGKVPKAEQKYFDLGYETSPMNLRIYEVKDSLQRAYICKAWRWADSHKQALENIYDPNSSGFDAETNALIEPLPDNAPAYSTLMPPTQKSKSTANDDSKPKDLDNRAVFTQQGYLYPSSQAEPNRTQAPVFLKDLPEHISISANLSQPGFLILADQYYPGWTAHIDSVAAPIYRANGVFRGVYVPSGGHLIQFDYEPESVFIGLCLSGVGLTLLLGFLWASIWPTIWQWLRLMSGED